MTFSPPMQKWPPLSLFQEQEFEFPLLRQVHWIARGKKSIMYNVSLVIYKCLNNYVLSYLSILLNQEGDITSLFDAALQSSYTPPITTCQLEIGIV